MEQLLRILFVEDNESDVEIEKRLINKDGIHFEDRIVESKEDFISALTDFIPDLILCDYSLPRFDGMRALLLRKELAPLTPFILVTGSMNEEVAVECMKAGADDYVLKQNIIRLVPAIKAAFEKKQTLQRGLEAEMALRTSEKRFQQIAELAGEFIWETDSEGLYTYVNKISEDILGYSSDEIIGKKHFYDFFVPELAEELKITSIKAFSEKHSFKNFENSNLHKDGHVVILSTIGMPVMDEAGNFMGYRGVDTDITEQKRAEQALRESEERFRNLYSNMGEGVCFQKLVFDHAGKAIDYKIVGVNKQYESILSLKEEDVVGKLASEVYGTGIAPYLSEGLQVVTTGIPFSFESYYAPMNKYFFISISPWDINGYATIFAEITDRIKSEELLRQERQMLRALIDHIPDTIYVKDAECRKIIANPADLAVMGAKSEEEIIGKTDVEIFTGDMGKSWFDEDIKVLTSGQPFLNQEGSYIDKKGKQRWHIASKIPLKDETGKITGLVGIGHDITDRKHSEEQIKQKAKELALSNDELTRFNRLAIGREMRMIELKQHCNKLSAQLGIPLPYNLDFLKQDINLTNDNSVYAINEEIAIEKTIPESKRKTKK